MATKNQAQEEHHQDANQNQPRRGRGFAGMDAERQRQISAEGGRAAHQKGTAHEFDSQEAREAGRKGGQASGGTRRRRSGGGAEGGTEPTPRHIATGNDNDQAGDDGDAQRQPTSDSEQTDR